jgi:hypothetical protein
MPYRYFDAEVARATAQVQGQPRQPTPTHCSFLAEEG